MIDDDDARLTVFVTSPKEVFRSVAHRHEIWREDPFDVEAVHQQARAVFQRMIARATTPPGVPSGSILLLLGESGAGKTHLMRAFRNHVHSNGCGFVGYMQMTTAAANYGRYVLSNLIDSLDQPYYESLALTSSLVRLSNALASRSMDADLLERLREDGELGFDDVADAVGDAADLLVMQPRYADIDMDLVRALLFLQRDDPRIKTRIVKYLRCEDMSDRDRAVIGGLVPKRHDDDPQRVVEHLGRLMWAVDSLSLVICLDQLEDLFNVTESEGVFRRAMATVCALADRVPSSIFVISCLEDYFDKVEAKLTRSILDRIQHDPEPVLLQSARTSEEIDLLVGQRLTWLYESNGVERDVDEPTFPLPRVLLDRLVRLRTRDVLERCREYREECIAEHRLVSFLRPTLVGVGPEAFVFDPEKRAIELARFDLESAWNDHQAEHREAPPDDDAQLAALLAWALEACSPELGGGRRVRANAEGANVEVAVTVDGATERLFVGICNRPSRAGALAKQIAAVVEAAGDRVPIVVRSASFPENPNRSVTRQLEALARRGGRRVVVEDSGWRAMLAFKSFLPIHRDRPHLDAWQAAECPLSSLLSIATILGIVPARASDTIAAP